MTCTWIIVSALILALRESGPLSNPRSSGSLIEEGSYNTPTVNDLRTPQEGPPIYRNGGLDCAGFPESELSRCDWRGATDHQLLCFGGNNLEA